MFGPTASAFGVWFRAILWLGFAFFAAKLPLFALILVVGLIVPVGAVEKEKAQG